MGALCGGLGSEQADALGRFGDAFGMAFQVLDDVLDIIGDPTRLGKPVGIDVATGVYTLPVLAALHGPGGQQLRGMLERREETAVGEALRAVRRSDGVTEALREADDFGVAASAALAGLAGSAPADGLASFPRSYCAWALEHLAAPGWASDVGQ
jgi:geranylgeranyl pyrophosphate synthase